MPRRAYDSRIADEVAANVHVEFELPEEVKDLVAVLPEAASEGTAEPVAAAPAEASRRWNRDPRIQRGGRRTRSRSSG